MTCFRLVLSSFVGQLLCLVFLLFPTLVLAQRDKVMNLPKFDQKKIHFGFTLGANNADFVVEHDLALTDSLIKLENQPGGGFQLGIIADLHMGPYFNLRFVPILMFSERIMQYSFTGTEGISLVEKRIESTYLDFPLSFKYRSKRLNNFATYLITGPKYTIDLASQENVDNQFNEENEIVIKLKRNSFNYELGFGFDFFLEYFKFSTEFKYSIGLNDVRVQDGTIFSDPISRLNSRMFLISFNFEG